MNRTDRLIGIVLALHGGRRTAAALAARFEVSRRTILRDIEALCQIGVPVVALPGAGGGFALPDDYWLPPLHLAAEEATLLLLALQGLGGYDDSPFGLARRTAEDKLRAAVRADVLAAVERDLDALAIAPQRRLPGADHVQMLRAAIQREGWVRVEYQSLRRVATHRLAPRRLYAEDGRWYCAAVSLEAAEERVFRLDRMLEIVPIAPPDGAAHALTAAAAARRDYRDPSHPEIVLRLTYQGVRLAEDRLPEHRAHPLDAVTWEIRFRCPPSELSHYAREIYALGPTAEALAPPELRRQIRDLAIATATQYGEYGKEL